MSRVPRVQRETPRPRPAAAVLRAIRWGVNSELSWVLLQKHMYKSHSTSPPHSHTPPTNHTHERALFSLLLL